MTKQRAFTSPLDYLTLGKDVQYQENYSPQLLQGVPRSLNRQEINVSAELPFTGMDIWNGYELSWLNLKGKPLVAIMQCLVPISSPNLIESKSFKLYLNSFNQHKIASIDELQHTLQKDLSRCAEEQVSVRITPASGFKYVENSEFEGECIDELDIEIDNYLLSPEYLNAQGAEVTESLFSNLLKSNCLITNQPDWASVFIRYQGQQIDKAGLLRYLISFRKHNEFHEQCVERIFCDIMHYCKPDKLTVYARYTRRGGLDINPFRSNFENCYQDKRLARQ
jgi:7-cyano-7-deazaguanine reductase